MSTYVEVTAPVGLHVEFGAVEIHDDGAASVFAGTSAHGQGHHTAFAMLASDVLGIPMDKITLVNSDTDRVPRGAGTMGSRSLQTAGSAIHIASNEVLARAQSIAAHLLEAAPTTSSSATAASALAGVPARTARHRSSWQLRRLIPPGSPKAWMSGRCAPKATLRWQLRSRSARTCRSSRSTPRPARSRCCATSPSTTARILNPLLVRGQQQHGGIAQGAAQALYEWVQYDADGNPLTANLMDYAIPSAAELPSYGRPNTGQTRPSQPLGPRASASRARSDRRRPSTTPSSTRCPTSA